MKAFFGIFAVCSAGLLVISFAGALHPVGDSLAVFRYPLVAVTLACALVLLRSAMGKALALACLALLAGRFWMGQAGEGLIEPDVVIYQKNMLFQDYDEIELARDIWASGARYVSLQEVSGAHRDFLTLMKDTHPHQLVCDGPSVGAIVVLSTDQAIRRTCSDPAGIAVLDVAGEQGQVLTRVVSVHLHWPWPHRQSEWLDAMLGNLQDADIDAFGAPERVIVGGDFNMVPWGHALTRIEESFGVARIGHVERTFELFGWPLTIDHVMAGPEATGRAEVRPRFGSDHFGVLGQIDFSGP